jgi:fatty-acyl-CoA synthase
MQTDLLPFTQTATGNTIGDGLTRSVMRFACKEAIIFQQRRWTYKQLDLAVNRVANRLLTTGLQQGDRVAAYGKNSDAYLILWLACARAGMIHVPVNFALIKDELSYLLDQSGAKAVFVDDALAEHVTAVMESTSLAFIGRLRAETMQSDTLDILSIALSQGNDQLPDVMVLDTDIVQILYTSGTTSQPKGAMHTHRSFMSEYTSCIHHLDLSDTDRSLAALPLYHSAQMHVFTMPALMIGSLTYLLEAPLPERVFEAISREKINSFFAPPTVWIGLLRHPTFDKHDLSSLKNIYYGASIMPTPIVAELAQRLAGSRLYNCYGQSEIAPLATVLGPDEHAGRLSSAGKPIMSVATRIVDPLTLVDCAPGERGEIVHRSPHLMIGYWNKPDETREAFEGGWFHSGDLAYADAEGFIYIVDRIKDVVNTGGILVASRDVEEALYLHPAVAEVAVIGTPHNKWIEAITAVVVLKPDQDATMLELVEHCHQYLAMFKVPKSIIFADGLPKNTAGKLLKRTLREQYSEAHLEERLEEQLS